MEPNVPSPGLPFGRFDGEAHFREWLLHQGVLRLNPLAMAARGSFLKGAWCRHVQHEQRSALLVVVLVACLASAAVSAAEEGEKGL